MILITAYRIFKTALNGFYRNGWVATATISIMVFTLFIIGSLFLMNVSTNTVLALLEDKIDLAVYFKNDTSESTILQMKDDLSKYSEVKEIQYISRDKALAEFKQKHQANEKIISSLQELENNPLEASLNIKASQANLYGLIADFINKSTYKQKISKVSYDQESNKQMIERFNEINASVRKGGLILSLVFAIIALLIVFNTVRLAIYTRREEIKIMRLVGAKNWFIQWPFIIQGALYGIISAIACLIIMYSTLYFASPKIVQFIAEVDLLYYFQHNFFMLSGILCLIGLALGTISSFVAVRRYLKV